MRERLYRFVVDQIAKHLNAIKVNELIKDRINQYDVHAA